MRTGIILAAIAIMSVSEAPSAHADGWFFSEGFGSSEVSGDLGEVVDGAANVRIAIGRRMGHWALEGFVMGNIMNGAGPLAGGLDSATSYGLSARYNFPLSNRFELYLRGGLHKMRLDVDSREFGSGDDFSGRAFHYGAGAMMKGKVPVLGLLFLPLLLTDYGPKVTGSLWVETSQQFSRLHHSSFNSVDANIKSWTMGFSLGSDF